MRFFSLCVYIVAWLCLLAAAAMWAVQSWSPSGSVLFEEIVFTYNDADLRINRDTQQLDLSDVSIATEYGVPLLRSGRVSFIYNAGTLSVSLADTEVHIDAILPRRQVLYTTILENLSFNDIAFFRHNIAEGALVVQANNTKVRSGALPLPLDNTDIKVVYDNHTQWLFDLRDNHSELQARGTVYTGFVTEFNIEMQNLPTLAQLPLGWRGNHSRASGRYQNDDVLVFSAYGVVDAPQTSAPLDSATAPVAAAAALWRANGTWAAARPSDFDITTTIDLRRVTLPDFPATVPTLSVSGVWHQRLKKWSYIADTVRLRSDDLRVSAVAFAGGDAQGLTGLAVSGGVAPLSLARAGELAGGDVADWFADAIGGGEVRQADFHFAVAPRAFQAAQVQVTAQFENAQLRIDDDEFPLVTALAGTLAINDDDIAIHGGGYYGSLFTPRVRAHIPRVNDTTATLYLNIISETAGSEMFLQPAAATRPIAEEVKTARDNYTLLGGQARLSLTLQVPLATPENTQVSARWQISQATILAPPLRAISNADADLNFSNDGMVGRVLGSYGGADSARITVALDIRDEQTINAAGVITAEDLYALVPFADFTVSGNVNFQLTVQNNNTVFIGDLTDTDIGLPSPLNHAVGASAVLSVLLNAAEQKVQYADNKTTINIIANDTGTNIGLNAAAVVPQRDGVYLHGSGSTVDLDDWLALGDADNIATFSGIALTLANATFLKTANPLFTLAYTATPDGNGHAVTIAATHLRGAVTILSAGQIRGHLNELHLAPQPTDTTVSVAVNGNGSDNIRAPQLNLSLTIDELIYDGITLGSTQVQTAAGDNNTWAIKQLRIENPPSKLSVSGYFENDHTYLTVLVNSNNGEELLRIFNISNFISEAEVSLFGIVSWPGAVAQFDLRQLRGEVRLLANDVVYSDLSLRSNLLNILSVFSPASLFSSLGFKEVANINKLLFREVSGDIALADGVAVTDAMIMENDDLSIHLAGATDYLNQTHNLNGRVRPGKKMLEAGSALGLGTGLLALDPASFIIGTILGKMFEGQISEIGGYDYTITGSWDEPVYEEIGITATDDTTTTQ